MTKICPKCGSTATEMYNSMVKRNFGCTVCDWRSTDEDTIDISYKDEETAPLSNLFPHKFKIGDKNDNLTCLSMESFIQSLREPDILIQEKIYSEYSGLMAYKMRRMLRDWRKTQTVFWLGKEIKREALDYTDLITMAYDKLFEQNILFREFLRRTKDKYLVHNIGCHDKKETLLTEEEYISQLLRLRNKF